MDIPTKKKHFAVFCLILLVTFSLRLYFFIQDDFITTDGAIYALSGENLLKSGRYEVFGQPQLIFPPGYPIAVGITNYFFDDLYFSAKLVSFLFGFLAVYLFYLIASEMSGKKAGFYAAFFSATFWPFVIYSSYTATESMYLFFILLAIYLYFRAGNKYDFRHSAILGLAIGISSLIRSEGLIFLTLIPFFFLRTRSKEGVKKAAKRAALIFAFFLLIFLPYAAFMFNHSGKTDQSSKENINYIASVVFNGKAFSDISLRQYELYEKIFFNYDKDSLTLKLPKEYEKMNFIAGITGDPVSFFKLFGKGFLSEMNILLIEYKGFVLMIPILIFFVIAIRFKRRAILRDVAELMFFCVAFLFIFPIFHVEARYLLQVLALLVLAASVGMSLSKEMLCVDAKRFEDLNKIILKNMALVTALSLTLFNFSDLLTLQRNLKYVGNPAEHKMAAEFIKNDSGIASQKSVIMSRKPFAAFYSGSEKSVQVPYADVQNILEFAKANKVNYIVIDERFLGIRDNYSDLENLGKYSNNISLVFKDDSIYPIKVFKIVQ